MYFSKLPNVFVQIEERNKWICEIYCSGILKQHVRFLRPSHLANKMHSFRFQRHNFWDASFLCECRHAGYVLWRQGQDSLMGGERQLDQLSWQTSLLGADWPWQVTLEGAAGRLGRSHNLFETTKTWNVWQLQRYDYAPTHGTLVFPLWIPETEHWTVNSAQWICAISSNPLKSYTASEKNQKMR